MPRKSDNEGCGDACFHYDQGYILVAAHSINSYSYLITLVAPWQHLGVAVAGFVKGIKSSGNLVKASLLFGSALDILVSVHSGLISVVMLGHHSARSTGVRGLLADCRNARGDTLLCRNNINFALLGRNMRQLIVLGRFLVGFSVGVGAGLLGDLRDVVCLVGGLTLPQINEHFDFGLGLCELLHHNLNLNFTAAAALVRLVFKLTPGVRTHARQRVQELMAPKLEFNVGILLGKQSLIASDSTFQKCALTIVSLPVFGTDWCSIIAAPDMTYILYSVFMETERLDKT